MSSSFAATRQRTIASAGRAVRRTPEPGNTCRDTCNEEAEVWEGAQLKCAHCQKTWWGIFLMRLLALTCPHCGQTTRKRVVREL